MESNGAPLANQIRNDDVLVPPLVPEAEVPPAATPTPQDPIGDRFEAMITALVVLGSALFVFWQVQPELIFSNTTPTGGDMGAHVWGPAFLRDELLPRFRLTGWTPDWYSGFPAFHFYMVLPALAIVLLDVGLHPAISIPLMLALSAYTFTVWQHRDQRRKAIILTAVTIAAAPLIIAFPYNIAFKIVAVIGVVMFPVAAWALGHLGGLRFPGPAFLSLASLVFLFDRSFNIYGGNIASTLAGEFAASISLTCALVALGLIIRGTRTGQYRSAAAAMIALTGLTHLLPAFFLLAAVTVLMLLRVVQRRWQSIPWLAVAGSLGALISAFWVLPFFFRTDYLNDMGWERIKIIHSPLVTRSTLNPADVLSDYPPLPVLLLLAVVGAALSIRYRVELGFVLAGTAAIMAVGFIKFPDGRLWNARILPFYYLSVGLLAGLGLALLARSLGSARFRTRVFVALAAIAVLLVPAVREAWTYPEPTAGASSYFGDASLYAFRVYATVALVATLLTEVPRQLSRLIRQRWLLLGLVATAVMVASPTRDLNLSSLNTADGVLWGLVLFACVSIVVTVLVRAVREFVAVINSPVPPAAREHIASDDSLEGETTTVELRPGFEPEHPRIALRVAPIVAGASLFILLGLALNVLGGTTNTDEGRSWSLAGQAITSDDNSFVPGWARWNFSGLESKARNDGANGDVGKGGYEEYEYVQRSMIGVGEQVGCGRAMWEFAPELNRYGTTMAMMLMPMWSDGCIGSMEGLYFEATPTVPYHFMLQTDLSAPSREIGDSGRVGGPSQAMRDLPYATFDIETGVEHLLELGVRYYMAFSPPSISAAREHPGLTEVASATPWVVFETTATLVEPLTMNPVVLDGVRNHQDQWLDVGIEWFTSDSVVRPASSGPDDWDHIPATTVVDRYAAEDTRKAGSITSDAEPMEALLPATEVGIETTVTDIDAGTDRISFSVDQIGTPVLVKASYFPSWSAHGADGPYRVAPNFMVVVPTQTEVELIFERKALDWLAIVMSLAGIAGAIAVTLHSRRTRRSLPTSGSELEA